MFPQTESHNRFGAQHISRINENMIENYAHQKALAVVEKRNEYCKKYHKKYKERITEYRKALNDAINSALNNGVFEKIR